jgi:hypothetical protein
VLNYIYRYDLFKLGDYLMPKNYVVTAEVCDVIRSVPVDKKQASQLSKLTKAKIPRAKVKIKRV